MKAFRRVTARAAVLDRPDVDTDQIIPKQFLKRIERTGFGEFLFFDWRRDPDFELNQPAAQGARILLAGRNFGCGSSREHAPWALQDYGFDAIVAPTFGDIFRQNSLQIGLLPIALDAGAVKELMAAAAAGEITVDLERQVVETAAGASFPFELDEFARHCILEGLDEIALTLKRGESIEAYESSHPAPIATTALT
jgi:3-isopropylmalate/(R)-2-methylmalate dehydratase small subunit